MSYILNLGYRSMERVLGRKANQKLAFDASHFKASMRRPGILIEESEISIVYVFRNTGTQLTLFRKDKATREWKIYFEKIWFLIGELEGKAELTLKHVLKRANDEKGSEGIEIAIKRILLEEFNSN